MLAIFAGIILVAMIVHISMDKPMQSYVDYSQGFTENRGLFGYCTVPETKILQGPGITYDVIGSASTDEVVLVMGKSNHWFRINLQRGQQLINGWVNEDNISVYWHDSKTQEFTLFHKAATRYFRVNISGLSNTE